MLQWEIYEYLKEHTGWQTIKKMAKNLKVTHRQRISEKLLHLAKYGFIEIKKIDGRTNMYRLKKGDSDG